MRRLYHVVTQLVQRKALVADNEVRRGQPFHAAGLNCDDRAHLLGLEAAASDDPVRTYFVLPLPGIRYMTWRSWSLFWLLP